MNIILVNHYASCREYSPNYTRVWRLTEEYVRQGHSATVVSASYSHLYLSQPEVTDSVSELWCHGVRYLHLKTPAYHANGLSRVLNMTTFVWQLWHQRRKIIGDRKPDIIIAATPYILDIYPCKKLAKAYGARVIREVRDIWPLSLVELSGQSPRSPYIKLLEKAERYSYEESDYIVSTLPFADAHMYEHGLAQGKFLYIPQGVDADVDDTDESSIPSEHRQLLSTLHARHQFIVCYAGGHYGGYALDSFIDTSQRLSQQPIAFVLIGDGHKKTALQQRVTESQLSNVYFLPTVPRTCLQAILRKTDVLFLGREKAPVFRFGSSPNKLMDYLLSGRPVIHATDYGNDLVADSNCGVSISAENPELLASAIIRLAQLSDAERAEMGARGRDYVLVHHNYRALAERYLNLMEELLDRQVPAALMH